MEKIDVDEKWGNFPNLPNGQVIGEVGRRCRNKWYVEICVEGRWGKAEILDWVVSPGDRVQVKQAWVSADGRDEEWTILGVVREEPPAPPAVAADPVPALVEEPATETEKEHPAAYDFMEAARRAAFAAYAR